MQTNSLDTPNTGCIVFIVGVHRRFGNQLRNARPNPVMRRPPAYVSAFEVESAHHDRLSTRPPSILMSAVQNATIRQILLAYAGRWTAPLPSLLHTRVTDLPRVRLWLPPSYYPRASHLHAYPAPDATRAAGLQSSMESSRRLICNVAFRPCDGTTDVSLCQR